MEPTKIVQENITSITLAGNSMVIGTNIEKKPEPNVSQTTIEGEANIYEVYQDIQMNHNNKFTDKILVPSSN